MVSKKPSIILGFCICSFNIASLISLIIYAFFFLMINPNMDQETIYSNLPLHMIRRSKMNHYLGSKRVTTWLEKWC